MNEYLRQSARAAALIQQKLDAVHTGNNRGVKQSNRLAVLNTARRPAVLVEMGYSTNPSDARILTGRPDQQSLATAIADAIVSYLLEAERIGASGAGVPMTARGGPGPRGVFRWPLLLLAGCAYYNGMYNANRLARAAEKAEREGRTFDATSFWGQVGVKADTVLARHPQAGSPTRPAASGQGLPAPGRLRQRGQAAEPGGGDLTRDAKLVEDAALLLGRCYQVLGNTEEAMSAFARLLNSSDSARRHEALFQHGRSLRLGGRYRRCPGLAGADPDPRARGERMAALAGLGQLDRVDSIADSLLAAADTSAPWDSTLALAAWHDPGVPAAWWIGWWRCPRPRRASVRAGCLMTEPGWRDSDPAAAEQRIRQAIAVGGDPVLTNQARLSLLHLRLRRATSRFSGRTSCRTWAISMWPAGEVSIASNRITRGASMVIQQVDTVAHGAADPDLRLFLAAETARDTLAAPPCRGGPLLAAAAGVRGLAVRPEGVARPRRAGSNLDDSALAMLRDRYPDSPYLAAASGLDAPRFAVLEDSLRAFALVLHQTMRPPQRSPPRPVQPSNSRLPEN